MKICVIGDLSDLTMVYVAWTARQMGLDVVELEEGTIGCAWRAQFASDTPSNGLLHLQEREIEFTKLAGAYVRMSPEPALPDGLRLNPGQEFCFKSERRAGLHFLLETLPCPVANRPSTGRVNGSKPTQMVLLEEAGFAMPQWIVSNDISMVEQFAASHRQGVIYKACSGLRARVRKFDDELRERLRAGTSPVLVQQYISGRDVRVHVVGQDAFATQATGGSGVDYRFESEGVEYEATTVPENVRQLCLEVMQGEGLLIGGFDFRVTDDGAWYCLEVNPVPTFLPYEMSTGQPIAAALVRHLLSLSQADVLNA
jgi:glutathione synthase/RimK-type ligase-like ATP-grasp enzyme